MIEGLNPRILVYRDGTSQSQRLIDAPDPGSVNIEDRTLSDFLNFASGFAQYLNFYNKTNHIEGNWQGFLNGGLIDAAEQKKWLDGLLSYAETPDKAIVQTQGTPYSSPHLALFITFLKLLEKIKVQVNDFTKKHLDLYYDELLSIDKKQPVPDVVNIVVQLTADIEQLLIPKGTQLSAGKDSTGKDLIYETTRDTLISRAEVKNIKSLFVDKKVIGLREKRQKHFDRVAGFKDIMNMALGYELFDPEISDKNLPAAALRYLLKDPELIFIIRSVELKEEQTEWERIYSTLERGYRRLAMRGRVQASSKPLTLFGLLQIALGDSENRLPDFNNTRVDAKVLDKVYNDAVSKTDNPEKKQATVYINDRLMFSVEEFDKLAKSLKEEIAEARWREIYILLENARSNTKKLPLAVPVETEWKDIIAVDDVKAGVNTQTGYFKTFGTATNRANALNTHVPVGMAISSSRLVLREGKRNIDLYIAFNPIDSVSTAQLADAINDRKLSPPFLFYVSTGDGWKQLTEKALAFGNFLRPVPGKSMPELTINNGKLSTSTKPLSPTDAGDYIVTKNGTVYSIDSVIDADNARVSVKAKIAPQPSIKQYNRSELFLNAINVRFELIESDPEIVAPDGHDNTIQVIHHEPIIAIMLNDEQQTGTNGFNTWYQKFHQLTIANIRVDVEVKDLKALSIQNINSQCDPKKPFAPFGNDPVKGSRLHFYHPEISGKVIDAVTLNFTWMGAPKSFADYYGGYWGVNPNDMGGLNTRVNTNEDFKAELLMMDHGLSRSQKKDLSLFNKDNASEKKSETIAVVWPAIGALDLDEQQLNSKSDLTDHTRYFVLELQSDFKQAVYPGLVTLQALNYQDKKGYVLNPPYQPLLKEFTVSYQVAVDIDMQDPDNTGSVFHITPFGYAKATGNAFMPGFEDEGELYIGLSGLGKQQNLSLLFQLAVGSANPDMHKTEVTWSYLNQNEWVNFTQRSILSDTTNGLLNSGLLELLIPAGLNNNNTLVGNGLYWLRATVNNNTAAIPDLVNVIAQGVNAVFVDQDNAADHLAEPLKPGSITSTIDTLSGLKTIQQPFVSAGGQPYETDSRFYARVSERLRHKNRALTMWDYERIVLEQFPDIYKVKCLPGNFSGTMQDTGGVDVIVIPRIQGRYSFNSFQPKLSADWLFRISEFLGSRIPPFVSVTVKNPTYMQLRVRTALRIKQGYSEAYHMEKLEEELKRFLAPWAYDTQAEIVIGGSIHHNIIVNFIAQRPYIDHVNTIKLLQSRDGIKFRDVLDTEIAGEVSIVDPNVVLVSASSHELRLLNEDEFTDALTEGIGYMAIDVDFKINPDNKNT